MSEHPAKRPKTTALASTGVTAIDALPPDLLETICGFLDVRTLCTARLLCAQFRDAASRCIHSVEISAKTLRSRPESTLNNFPNLSRVSVSDLRREDLEMLAQSPVAAAVTHLRAHAYFSQEPQRAHIAAGFPLVPLPNLSSLTVGVGPYDASLFQQTLRELILGASVDSRIAELVAGMTNLTSLKIDLHMVSKAFEAVTVLTALQKLAICGPLSHIIPYVAELTLLTHLHFDEMWGCGNEPSAPLASLSRLRILEHLGVGHFGRTSASMECQILAGIATLTSLRSLDLTLGYQPERSAYDAVCMAPVSRLTALRLKSGGLDASFLLRFNLEMLQDMRLSRWVGLERDAVSALRWATGLTRLELWTNRVGTSVGPEEWEIALSRISRLRAVLLGTPEGFQPTFSLKAIALLTELTRLDLRGEGVTTNAGVQVCLGLKKLRVLSMQVDDPRPALADPITPETFFGITKLPELCKFDIAGNVGLSAQDLTEDVRASFNAERHGKGWPPLDLNFYADSSSYEYCYTLM